MSSAILWAQIIVAFFSTMPDVGRVSRAAYCRTSTRTVARAAMAGSCSCPRGPSNRRSFPGSAGVPPVPEAGERPALPGTDHAKTEPLMPYPLRAERRSAAWRVQMDGMGLRCQGSPWSAANVRRELARRADAADGNACLRQYVSPSNQSYSHVHQVGSPRMRAQEVAHWRDRAVVVRSSVGGDTRAATWCASGIGGVAAGVSRAGRSWPTRKSTTCRRASALACGS